MKKEIRLMLEYQCYPIWIYDENGIVIDNGLIEEIKHNEELVTMLLDLQNKYNSLFLDNHEEFKYIGFSLDSERDSFQEIVNNIYQTICILLNEKYNVINMVDI